MATAKMIQTTLLPGPPPNIWDDGDDEKIDTISGRRCRRLRRCRRHIGMLFVLIYGFCCLTTMTADVRVADSAAAIVVAASNLSVAAAKRTNNNEITTAVVMAAAVAAAAAAATNDDEYAYDDNDDEYLMLKMNKSGRCVCVGGGQPFLFSFHYFVLKYK